MTDTVKIDGYHGHVYYNAETREVAERLRETIGATLGVEVRALSDVPLGPHPVPQFRFTFTTAQFATIVPWLMFNRQGLDVLVHPLTDSSYDDHSRYAIWLGAAGGGEARHSEPGLPRRAVSGPLRRFRRRWLAGNRRGCIIASWGQRQSRSETVVSWRFARPGMQMRRRSTTR